MRQRQLRDRIATRFPENVRVSFPAPGFRDPGHAGVCRFGAAQGGSGWNKPTQARPGRSGHRPGGRVVMQRTANPRTPVRFRPWPPMLMRVSAFPAISAIWRLFRNSARRRDFLPPALADVMLCRDHARVAQLLLGLPDVAGILGLVRGGLGP